MTETNGNPQENVPTFDELLKNPDYQREFDKKLEGARVKWQTKWQEDADKQKLEAEKLASMKENEKHQYELDKANKEKENAISELNAYRLKEEASKIANEKGVDTSLLDLFDFSKENAESISKKIDVLKERFDKSVEAKLNEKLNQTPPQDHKQTQTNNDGLFNRASY